MHGLTYPFLIWLFSCVATSYSVYYDLVIIPVIINVLQGIFYVIALLAVGRWINLVRKNVGRFHFDNLTVEEYTFFQYLLPALLYAPSVSVWNWATGDLHWQTRSVETLIYYICANCLVAAVIIGEFSVLLLLWDCIVVLLFVIYIPSDPFILCINSGTGANCPNDGDIAYGYVEVEANLRATCIP